MSKCLFISCVSREFEPYRILLAQDLKRPDLEIKVQEDFVVTGGTTLEKLDDYIRVCDAVVHLIGDATGAFPRPIAVQSLLRRYPNLPDRMPPVKERLSKPDPKISYTQWEAYLAIYHDRNCYIYRPHEEAPRDPRFVPDPAEEQSQREHYDCICKMGRDRGQFANQERLSVAVLRDLQSSITEGKKLVRDENADALWLPLDTPDYSTRFAWATDALRKYLDLVNHRLDWSDGRFVELEAELEEASDTGVRRRATSLVKALRNTKGREVVLVLGEPGSGKSVAMRRLTATLLESAAKTGELPVYLNLREWDCPRDWSPTALPDAVEVSKDLWGWAKAQLQQRIGGAPPTFVDSFAETMRKEGRLFFVLDSFDEISALLDLPKENPLVERIANGVHHLLTADCGARGVIASRYDRSPARWLSANRWFDIRPLEGASIEQLVRNHFLSEPAAVWRRVRGNPSFADLP